MKKYLVVILAVIMLLGIVGCSSASNNDKTKMARIVNADLDDAKDDFNSALRHTSSDYKYEHKGASEYHLTGTAHFTGDGKYDVEVFYIFVKQSDGSFYVYSRDIGRFVEV